MLKTFNYIAFFTVFQNLISSGLLAMDNSMEKSDDQKDVKHINYKQEQRISERKYDNSHIIWEKSTVPSNAIPMHEEDLNQKTNIISFFINYILGH